MALPDIYTEGIASGWKVVDAAKLTAPQTMEADVAIIGSGAGGGVAAEILALAGLKVLLLEEGALRTSDSFKDMDEGRALRELYQEGAARATSDGAIAVLQGRSVGGSTTVNWTSSFRTPEPTLKFWAAEREVVGHGVDDMKPWFEKMEARLDVMLWEAQNANNSVLKRGCDKLGWETGVDFMKIIDASEDVVRPAMPEECRLDRMTMMMGYAGVYSSFLKHAGNAAERYGVSGAEILHVAGERKLIGGQEDQLIEIALELKAKQDANS